MKKILILMLTLAMIAGLCACGGSKAGNSTPDSKAAYRPSFEKAEEYVDPYFVDTKNLISSTQDDSDSDNIYKYWLNSKEMDDAPLSAEIEIDGSKIILGKTTAKELEDFGFEVERSSDAVRPGEAGSLTVGKGDKICNMILDVNETDKELPIDDFAVSEVITFQPENSLPFSYCGLTVGSTLDDVLETLGTPNFTVTLTTTPEKSTLEIDYYNENEDGKKTIADCAVLTLYYDPDSNSADLRSIDVSHERYDTVTTEK